jgi:hypothetical protein
MFVEPADEDYITARWCRETRFSGSFFWLAAQAIEKYSKAILLLNRVSVKKYKHDLLPLYDAIAGFCGSLIPESIEVEGRRSDAAPENINMRDFVEYISSNGSPHSRYRQFSYAIRLEHLHMLDRCIFVLRRLACQLDGPIVFGMVAPNSDILGIPINLSQLPSQATWRDLLKAQPQVRPWLGLTLEDAIRGKVTETLVHAALNMNASFAPAGYPHKVQGPRTRIRNTMLDLLVLDPLELAFKGKFDDRHETAVALGNWVLENIRLDPALSDRLEELLAASPRSSRPGKTHS